MAAWAVEGGCGASWASKLLFLVCVISSALCGVCAQTCNTSALECVTICTAARPELAGCSCDLARSRCTCQFPGAALQRLGGCLAPVPGNNVSACGEGEMMVRALLVIGTMASPELDGEHTSSGQVSAAAATIFRLAAARAMGLGDAAEKVSFLDLRLSKPPAEVQRRVTSVGPVVVDIHMDFCAEGATELPHGADFEHRFAITTQDFAAFHPSALRLLELEDLSQDSLGPAPVPSPRSRPQALRNNDSPFTQEEAPSWLSDDVVLWITMAMFVTLVALGALVWRLVWRRRQHKQATERLEFEVAASGPYDNRASAGPSSHVTTVLFPFDPTAEDGKVFAAAAGLQPSECLKVAVGDVMEIIAFGEGWLYGRLLGAEMFGYLPEECVQRVPHTPPASAIVLDGGLARSVAAAAAA